MTSVSVEEQIRFCIRSFKLIDLFVCFIDPYVGTPLYKWTLCGAGNGGKKWQSLLST